MIKKILLPFVFSVILLPPTLTAQQSENKKMVDGIVAIVNNHIILKSEVDQRVSDYMLQYRQQSNQSLNFSKDLWYSALEETVEKYILLEKAKLDSITVSEDQVDQRIDQRIQQVISQLGSERALEDQFGKSVVQLKQDLRETYRTEMIVQKYQQDLMDKVDITRPEVKQYFEQIPQDSLPTIPEQVAVSQIVAVPPPMENAEKAAYELAKQLRDSVVIHDKNFEELARKYSDGPSAPNGGKLPLMSLNDLVAEYSAAASALQPGEISNVVKTTFGYHVIRLNRRVGDQIDTNHILISIDEENYDEQAAIDRLKQLRDSVMTNENVSFAELARKYSDDPNTAPQGGRIFNPRTGERMIPLSQLDPAMYRIVLLLDEPGDISEPKPFNLGSASNRAFRIVRLDRRVEEHVANFKDDYERIRQSALQEKRFKHRQKLMRKFKKEVYVEYKIDVPTYITNPTTS